MRYTTLTTIALVILLILFIPFYTVAADKAEIIVSKSVKEVIEEAAPTKQYSFYARKESYPKSIKEMMKAELLVCGEVEGQADLKVLMATLKDLDMPLFKSVRRYFVNPNMLSGKVSLSEKVSLKTKSGKIYKIPRKKVIYGKKTSIETLINECFEVMGKNSKSVLLSNKNVKSDVLNKMIEIVFKVR